MTQNYRLASTCLDLAESCHSLLPQLETQASPTAEPSKRLATTLKTLLSDLRIVLIRAERRQQRRAQRALTNGGNSNA
jgi:hypothetical protein